MQHHFTLIFILCCFGFTKKTIAQIPCWEEEFPFVEITKIELPHKKNFKHHKILGQYHNGSILVRCANANNTSRQFFWVDKNGQYLEKPDANQKKIQSIEGIQAISSFGKKFMLLSIEKQGKAQYFISQFSKGKLQTPKELQINWGYKINNPCLFQLPTSNYPALIFSTEINKETGADLFVAEQIDGSWRAPQRIENEDINSNHNEINPFVGTDGMLYFSSDRPQIPAQENLKTRPTDLWFAQPDYRKYWKETAVNPFPAPFNSPTNEAEQIALKNDFKQGFFIADSTKNTKELYQYHLNIPDEEISKTIQYYALLIGVNDYENLNQLQGPIPNTHKLGDVLKQDYGFQVEILQNPTGEKIIERLSNYQHLQENEYLVVSFFGHGIHIREKNVCALAGTDGNHDGSNCILPNDFQRTLQSIEKPKHILLILDACFSGLFKPAQSRGEIENNSRKVMTSTKSSLVFDDSVFYFYLNEKLKNGPERINSEMWGKEIYDYIFKNMSGTVGNENLPNYFDLPNSGGGEFPFPEKK